MTGASITNTSITNTSITNTSITNTSIAPSNRAGDNTTGVLQRGPDVPVQRGPDVPILMYHEITTTPRSAGRLAVTPDNFARQLAYLAEHDYHGLSAGQFAAAIGAGGGPLPPRSVVLTFDDGFADFHDVALPLLREHGFTATLYVTSGWVAGRGRRCRGAPSGMLSWDQLRSVASAGIEIGGHSLSHPQLDQLPPESLRQELTWCKSEIEDQLGTPVTGVAYPFGYSSRLVRATAACVGYEYGCVVGNRLARYGGDVFALPRLTIAAATRRSGFARAVTAGQLAPAFARYRLLTKGFAVIRRARSAKNRIVR
jgi:peptidoglycan/xylan/chitin deacetylase (PgdA/CDA1 family)